MKPQYITNPSSADCHAWKREGDWLWSIEPLQDLDTGLYAHLTYDGAKEAVDLLGGELPTHDDILELQRTGFFIEPIMLPDHDMIQAAGVSPGSQQAIDQFRNENMGTIEWARIHDDRVRARLVSGRWDGFTRVLNAGKHWIAGAPRGRAYLMGWWTGKGWIQSGASALMPDNPGPHGSDHHDYATTTLAKKRWQHAL